MTTSELFFGMLVVLFVFRSFELFKQMIHRSIAQKRYEIELMERSNRARDTLEVWEAEHPTLWVDGYCEYFRSLLIEAIEAHERLIEELAYDCQDIVDMWYEILAGWSDIPPDGDSHESPSFLLWTSAKTLRDFK